MPIEYRYENADQFLEALNRLRNNPNKVENDPAGYEEFDLLVIYSRVLVNVYENIVSQTYAIDGANRSKHASPGFAFKRAIAAVIFLAAMDGIIPPIDEENKHGPMIHV